jgi:hypothetical protein
MQERGAKTPRKNCRSKDRFFDRRRGVRILGVSSHNSTLLTEIVMKKRKNEIPHHTEWNENPTTRFPLSSNPLILQVCRVTRHKKKANNAQ